MLAVDVNLDRGRLVGGGADVVVLACNKDGAVHAGLNLYSVERHRCCTILIFISMDGPVEMSWVAESWICAVEITFLIHRNGTI